MEINPEFFTPTNHTNPPHNKVIFEEYFGKRFMKEYGGELNGVTYLPVLWTNYYISQGYKGSDRLNSYLLSLDQNRPYFTVHQWDDGVIWKPKDLSLFSFASSHGDYPIPLLCQIPPNEEIRLDSKWMASFVGKIFDRHPVRDKMYAALKGFKNYLITEPQQHDYELFKYVMRNSVFALCPRGYGKNSFRVNEALHYGAIPVVIYDEPWFPFPDKLDLKLYGYPCHVSKVFDLPWKLKRLFENKQKLEDLRTNGQRIYRKYYTYDGCYQRIIEKIKDGVCK